MVSRPLPELIDGPDGPNISFKGKVLYAGSNSPDKRAEAAVTASQTLYLVVSPLLFKGVETLLKGISSDSYVLAIEKNPDIYSITKNSFAPIRNSQISYIKVSDGSSPSEIIRNLDPSKFRRIVTVKLNGGYMLYRNFYNTFCSNAEIFLQSFWKNRMTTIHMGRLWCRNIFLNIPALNNASPLSSLHTEKAIIIAGAGESLEGCLPFIRKHRTDFFVVAADTAVSTLLNGGVKADLLVVLEAQHANLYDFYNPESLKIPAAFDLTSSPEIIRKHKGDKYFFISEFDETQLLTSLSQTSLRPPRIPPLGSVGIAAVYIALCISSKTIFHCGLDFSFIPDKYHSAGSPSHILTMMNEHRTMKPGFYSSAFNGKRLTRPDKSGRTVYTDVIMLSYAERLKELSSLSARLVDIADKGIDSTGHNVTNPEIILKYASENKTSGSAGAGVDFFKLEETALNSDKESIVQFLNNEVYKIDLVTAAVITFLNRRNDETAAPGLSAELEKQIKAIDYTYLFFPDQYHPSSDVSFLKRLLYSAAWFKNNIQKTLSAYC
jgi:hypothetical protein